MELMLANSNGAVTQTIKYIGAGGIPNLQGDTFLKPLYLQMNDRKMVEPYRQHIWTYSCINAKATALKGVPFLLVRYDGNDKNKSQIKSMVDSIRNAPVEKIQKFGSEYIRKSCFEIVEDGPVYDLFNRPNPLMCQAQLWESYMILMHMSGEVFWVLDGGKNPDGSIKETELPSEIYPFGKNMFVPVVEDGRVVRWKRPKQNGMDEKFFDMHQIIRFYRYNPYDMLRGLAPFDVVSASAQQDFKAQVFNEALFDNGGVPSFFFKIERFLEYEERKKLFSMFDDRHKGPENAGKPGIAQGGADILWNPNKQTDMQYMEGRKWNRDETHAGFGVPKIKNSIYEDIQLATALQADKSFWQDQIVPEARYIESWLSATMFSGRIPETQGLYPLFDFSKVQALQSNAAVNSEVAKRYFDMGLPVNQINERLELGFEPVPWGDVGYLPIGLVPADQIEDKSEDTEENHEDDSEDDSKKTIIHTVTKATRNEKITKIWIARVFNPIEPKFQDKLKKFWFDLRKEQLQKFEEATKAIPSIEDLEKILFDSKEWGDKLKKTSMPFLQTAAKLAIEDTVDLLNVDAWETTDPRIMSILDKKVNKIKGITDRFWQALKTNISNGITSGENVTQLSDRIRTQFNMVASPSRTLTIARTETAQIASPVRHAVLSGEGVKTISWGDSGDDHVRGDHQILGNAGIKPIGYNWMMELARSGETLRFPSDPSGPADQVINCRCNEIPED